MDSNCYKWYIIPVTINLKPKELPPTDNHHTDLVGKVKHHGKKNPGQMRDAIRPSPSTSRIL
jgi:hypothetical protein